MGIEICDPDIEDEVLIILRLNKDDLRVRIIGMLKEISVLKYGRSYPEISNQHLVFHIDSDPMDTTYAEETTSTDIETEFNCIPVPSDYTYIVNGDVLALPNMLQADSTNIELEKTTSGVSCFNCKGAHTLADCTKPRDRNAIGKNRRRLTTPQSQRYHVDIKQRFSQLAPGGLPSEALRKALGLKVRQLPSYVYRLRQMGYPPGWLQDAIISNSELQVYTDVVSKRGDKRSNSADIEEIGEKVVIFDESRVKEWPGFNVPEPSNYRDDTLVYQTPPRHSSMSAENMRAWMRSRRQTALVTQSNADLSADVVSIDEVEEEGEIMDEVVLSDSNNKTVNMSDCPSTPVLDVCKVLQGTPIISLISPYSRLPSQEKWAKDTTDHILYENLPESTGKWEQMSNLLKRSREKMSKRRSMLVSDSVEANPSPPKMSRMTLCSQDD